MATLAFKLTFQAIKGNTASIAVWAMHRYELDRNMLHRHCPTGQRNVNLGFPVFHVQRQPCPSKLKRNIATSIRSF
jgi:hypothetical protein